MTFSFSVKHKKDKKIFLHIDLTYFYQNNKMHIHTLSVQSSMQLQQKEIGTNIYVFNRAPVQILLSWRAQLNLIAIENIIILNALFQFKKLFP